MAHPGSTTKPASLAFQGSRFFHGMACGFEQKAMLEAK